MAKWPLTNSPFCPESLLGKRTRTNCLSKLTQDLFSGRAIGTGIITRYLKQIFYLAERTIKNGKNNYKQFILLNNSRPYWITYILTSNLKSRIIQNTWPSWIRYIHTKMTPTYFQPRETLTKVHYICTYYHSTYFLQ
jgi:hypothetical protein